MINLIESPQRADYRAKYTSTGDVLTIKIDDTEEVFDFSGFEDGVAEQIVAEKLPINPIISAEKTGDIISVVIIRFYNKDEKYLFEGDIYG